MKHALLSAAVLALALPASPAVAEEGTSLTVYSSADPAGFDPQQFVSQQRLGHDPAYAWQVPGFGVVREVRRIEVPAGESEVRFADVAEFVDPTTVAFVDVGNPGRTAVLEQSFRFDLASPDKILERYVDREISHEARAADGTIVSSVTGRVLSVNQGTVVLRTADGLRFVPTRDPGLRLPSLPEGLLTRPTFLWKVRSSEAGPREVRTTYQTAGITWKADYNLVLAASETSADVSAWVTLLNLSGAGYRNATLKLVAGDVQRIEPAMTLGFEGPPPAAPAPAGAADAFEEKAFFEYHLYTLPRKTDVLDASTQQITLFPQATGVTVRKHLVYYGFPEAAHWGAFPQPRVDRDIRPSSNPKVDVWLRWKNARENRMGMPLPRGKVRVYQQDPADGTLEFLGEDLIDHTPRDEEVSVRLGQAFDVVGERTQTAFEADTRRRTMRDAYRITLRNHKDAAQRVTVKENLFRWTRWEIESTTHPFTKVDARTVHFDVEVPPHGQTVVEYAVRYGW
jgi:hypothetical protein